MTAMRAYGQQLSRVELARRVGQTRALGGVRQVVLDDGAERGIRALEFRTGSGLTFEVLVDRAMDLGYAEHGGRGFGWRSATGYRHPGLHEHADEFGLGWLRSFTGLLVTGGLDHVGHVTTGEAEHFHYPARSTVWQPLHGRIANTPARLLGAGEQWSGDACTLWAEGEVRQAAVFGEDLRLRRRIEADLGGDELRLVDTVRNAGFARTPHALLYHLNLGWPLLAEGTRLVAPIRRTLFATPSVARQRVSYQTMPAPQPDFVEQVYGHELVADGDGQATVAVINDRLGMAIAVDWPVAELPGFAEWLHLSEGGYALAVEPTSREPGATAPVWLAHDETRTYHLRLRVVLGAPAIEELVARIQGVARQPAADVPDTAVR